MANLAELQRRFHAGVTADGDVGDLLATGDHAVYANMYRARLVDALASDYPKLHATLGHDAFHALADDYVRAHPPRSFTLRELGAALAAWLRDHPHAWAADLAALERARTEVFDGPDAAPITRDDVLALGEALPELQLRWIPSHRLVPTGWTVDELWLAIEDEQDTCPPVRESRTLLVWRNDLDVLHRTLEDDEIAIAPLLVDGVHFSALCERLAALHGADAASRALALLVRWLDERVITHRP